MVEFLSRFFNFFCCKRSSPSKRNKIEFLEKSKNQQNKTNDIDKSNCIHKIEDRTSVCSTFRTTKLRMICDQIKFMNDKEFDKFLNDSFNDEIIQILKLNEVCLPRKQDNLPTIVLDLDNTIIFPVSKKPEIESHEITIKYNGKEQIIWFIERPFLQEFLDELNDKFEIIVFTAGIREYASEVLKKIDSKNRIKYVLDRRFCTLIEKSERNQDIYIKNLKILGRDLNKTIIIDDRKYSYILNPENGHCIPAFNGEINDTALLKLKNYLLKCSSLRDFKIQENSIYI